MKNFIALLILAIGMLVVWPPGNQVQASNSDQSSFVVDQQTIAPAVAMQEEGGVAIEADNPNADQPVIETTGDFLKDNWIALLLGLLGFIELIVRLTPSTKDNSIFNWLATLINALLPNIKKGGGTFKVLSK